MPKPDLSNDDEIDLLELLITLWDGRWLIISGLILAILVGFGYLQFLQSSQAGHNVTIFYDTNNLICGEEQECINLPQDSLVGNWTLNKKSSKLLLLTTTPLSVNEYKAQFERTNEIITNKIYADAKNEVAFIEAALPKNLLDTEIYLSYTIDHKRIIHLIDNGQSALTFVSSSISEISLPKKIRVFVTSAILGGLISSIIVLIHSAFRRRNEQITKT